jgi:hypothetical protein
MLLFSTQLCDLHSHLLPSSLVHHYPPPFPVYLCICPDSESKKLQLLDHPIQKPWKGGGLVQINTSRKVLLQVSFLR